MIHFDAVDISERRPEEVISFFWRSVYIKKNIFTRVNSTCSLNLLCNLLCSVMPLGIAWCKLKLQFSPCYWECNSLGLMKEVWKTIQAKKKHACFKRNHETFVLIILPQCNLLWILKTLQFLPPDYCISHYFRVQLFSRFWTFAVIREWLISRFFWCCHYYK